MIQLHMHPYLIVWHNYIRGSVCAGELLARFAMAGDLLSLVDVVSGVVHPRMASYRECRILRKLVGEVATRTTSFRHIC